jgi:hypothetical protein
VQGMNLQLDYQPLKIPISTKLFWFWPNYTNVTWYR